MKEFFVSDCVQYENKIITSTFVVVSRQVKPKKSGERYLALTLGDRSGHIEAKMWDNVEDAIDGCDQDDFIKVKGLINKYKNRFQLTIHKLRRLGESEVDFADYLPKSLSGGMRQRVQLARGLAGSPRAVMMDEPFGALDAQTRTSMQRLLIDTWRAHPTTVVFVTHDVDEALLIGDRVAVLGRAGQPLRAVLDVQVFLDYTFNYLT